jgi:hypothetical protein
MPQPKATSNDLTEPTIANPFAKTNPTPVLPHKPEPKPESIRDKVQEFNAPDFRLSSLSRQIITEKIEKNLLTMKELPFICEMAKHAAIADGLNGPTSGHIEIAIALRTLENFEAVAAGTMAMPSIDLEYVDPAAGRFRNERHRIWMKASLELFKAAQ